MPKQKSKSAPASKKAAASKKTGAKPAKTSKTASSAGNKNTVTAASKKSASPAKKSAAKKAAPKKAVTRQAPAKKTAKAEVKKSAPNKLKTTKKSTTTTPIKASKSEKPVAKKIKKSVSKTTDNKVVKPSSQSKTKTLTKKTKKAFVMPKTSTSKARKYEPPFVKSVLDQAPEENNGPSMRYSDNELKEFKELITRKLDTAKKELGYLQGLITRKDEMGGDDTDNRYMTMEDGSLSMEREQLSQMASRQITFIDHLEKAMMRIENKTYGICRVTGKLIDKARLRAVPHATLSIEAKMGISK